MVDTKAALCCHRFHMARKLIKLEHIIVLSGRSLLSMHTSFIWLPVLSMLLQQCTNTVVFVVYGSILKGGPN